MYCTGSDITLVIKYTRFYAHKMDSLYNSIFGVLTVMVPKIQVFWGCYTVSLGE